MPITPNYFKRKSGVAQGAALFLFGTAFSFPNLSAIIPLGMGNFSLSGEKNFPGLRRGVFARLILLCGIVSNPEKFFQIGYWSLSSSWAKMGDNGEKYFKKSCKKIWRERKSALSLRSLSERKWPKERKVDWNDEEQVQQVPIKARIVDSEFLLKKQYELKCQEQLRDIKKIYNEEFDPGSGWTLAAGLTHASRGAAGCSNTLPATGARVRNAWATCPSQEDKPWKRGLILHSIFKRHLLKIKASVVTDWLAWH